MSDYTTSPTSPSHAAGSSSNSKAPVTGPSLSRFQRRVSERHFYEGAYRQATPTTPTMDYGAAGGNSPWASSPEASRTSFGDGDREVPRQDLPVPAIQEEHVEGNSDERGPQYGYHPPPGSWTQEQQAQWQEQQRQQQESHLSHASGEENRRPTSAARYHNVPPHHHHQQQHQGSRSPQQQQHMPHYKLSAKITGLERTGKKDPIFRFDVYVCQTYSLLSVSLLRKHYPC